MKHFFTFFFFSACKVVRISPPFLIKFLSNILGNTLFYLIPIRKKVIKTNLSRTICKNYSKNETNSLIKKNYIHYIHIAFDLLLIASYSKKDFMKAKKYFEIDDQSRQNMITELKKNKGLLLLTLHMGVWEALGIFSSIYDFKKVLVPVKFIKNCFFQTIRERIQEFPTMTLADVRDQNAITFKILKNLKKNGIVTFFHDQHKTSEDQDSYFWGYKVKTNPAIAVIHKKTNSPLLMIYTLRKEFKKYCIFTKKLDPEKFYNKNLNEISILELNNYFNDELQKIIEKNPEQWLWVHKRFKNNSLFNY